MRPLSLRTKDLTQSGIRSASSRCRAINGINLGQGVCDMPTPDVIKDACTKAMMENKTTYSPCEGIFPLREALAKKLKSYNGITACPETEIVVTHGSTGAFVSVVTTLFNPGDEVIVFEPFYGYHKNICELQAVSTKAVSINLADFSIDWEGLEEAISPKTKGIIVCTPCNPIGKVFTREELIKIGELAKANNCWVITDEIYEYITYPGHEHVSLASLADYADRTITISGFSKTYNMTGWRLGYVSGPAAVMKQVALVQDLYYVCPATPLQYAALAAFDLPQSYFDEMRTSYLAKRDLMSEALREFGFTLPTLQGAYYIMAELTNTPFENDRVAFDKLLNEAKVAIVTGRSFYTNPDDGVNFIRVCYALDQSKLEQALEQIRPLFT